MGERLVSCLKCMVMTIFISKKNRKVSGRAKPPRYYSLVALLACALTWANVPLAQAVHFQSAKERADGDALYQQAFAAYQASNYAQAQTLIEKADQLKPDQPDGWNLRGMVFLKQNAFHNAEAAFMRAVALDPKLWAAQFNLAEVPFQGKDYARARVRFENLLGQTDRFKQAKEWELVQYKVFLSCLLMKDNGAAAKRMAKLPATGGVTPAYLYAQAALSFSRKDPTGAQKPLAAAQTAFSPLLNDLFYNSLVEAGWQAPLAPTVMPDNALAYASPHKGSAFGDNHTPVVIDPRMEAAVADPLPSDPDSRVVPPKTVPVTPHAARQRVTATPAPALAPTPPPDAELPRRELLLE